MYDDDNTIDDKNHGCRSLKKKVHSKTSHTVRTWPRFLFFSSKWNRAVSQVPSLWLWKQSKEKEASLSVVADRAKSVLKRNPTPPNLSCGNCRSEEKITVFWTPFARRLHSVLECQMTSQSQALAHITQDHSWCDCRWHIRSVFWSNDGRCW